MAMVTCRECGKEISDMAGTCPHCGYPIQAVKNVQIDQQNKQYYKALNKKRLITMAILFALFFGLGAIMFTQKEIPLWYWGVYFLNFAIVLFLCLARIPYIIAFFVHATQSYFHLTRASYFIAITFGYAIGGCYGMNHWHG